MRLKSTNEQFTIERPTSTVNNLIFGEMYVEHVGTMTVQNMLTKDKCEIEFKKRGWGGKNAFEFEGYCIIKFKEKKYKVEGKWNSHFTITNLESKE